MPCFLSYCFYLPFLLYSSPSKVICCASLTWCCLFRNKMIKNWGVIGGIAAAIAAGVYVLWGPITEIKKRKRGKNQCDKVTHRWYVGCWLLSSNWQWRVFSFRYGSWSVELRQHLLPELFASGFGSMSVLHQVAGDVFRLAYDPVVQRQPAVHDTASASQW